MNKMDRLILGIYGTFYMFAGIVVSFFGLGYLNEEKFTKILDSLYISSDDNMLWLVMGSIVFLSGISILNLIFLNNENQKSIVFKTDKGEVKISLSAIEEYIKKTTLKMKEIKDIKSKIVVKGKSLKISTKVILKSEKGVTNIIGRVQGTIEKNVSDMLGVEIKINTNVNVIKMAASKHEAIPIEKEEEEEEVAEENFQGIQY